MKHRLKAAVLAALLGLWPAAGIVPAAAAGTVATARGGETVSIGGVDSILIRRADARGGIILLTGGDGRLEVGAHGTFRKAADNVLIRNRDGFAAAGFNVLLLEDGTDLAAAIGLMAGLKSPVAVVATSAGTPRAAQGIARGARPDRLVLTSGFLSEESGPSRSVMAILGHPDLLPPTLVIHHRQDGCRFTSPAGVAPFLAWAGDRAQVAWITGGRARGNPCRWSSHHGFAGRDAELVSLIVGFTR